MLVKRADELRPGDIVMIADTSMHLVTAAEVVRIDEDRTGVTVCCKAVGGIEVRWITREKMVPILGNTGGLTPWPA